MQQLHRCPTYRRGPVGLDRDRQVAEAACFKISVRSLEYLVGALASLKHCTSFCQSIEVCAL